MKDNEFARPMVNSGRLSLPCTYDGSSLNGEDALPEGPATTRPGTPCTDAQLAEGYLLGQLHEGFSLLAIDADVPDEIDCDGIKVTSLTLSSDASSFLAERYLGAAKSAVYLIRPDQHVAARWPSYEPKSVAKAVASACAKG